MSKLFRHIRPACALLLGASMSLIWNHILFLPLIFFVFAALLLLIDQEYKLFKQYFVIIVPFLLAWNISTLWWVWNASVGGFLFMTLFNTIIVSGAYLIYALSRRLNIARKWRYILWASSVLSLEYMHYNWEGNFPWLNLGNSFSIALPYIQWISYTGIAGISLWILIVNILVHHFSNRKLWNKFRLGLIAILIGLPMLSSWIWVQYNNEFTFKNAHTTQVVLLQPNIDTYDEKFDVSPLSQVQKFLSLSIQAQQQLDTSKPILWIWPETCIPNVIRALSVADTINNKAKTVVSKLVPTAHSTLVPIQKYLQIHPKVTLITGIALYNYADEIQKEVLYNTAVNFWKGNSLQSHVKGKLVPGGEAIPYQSIFNFLEKYVIDLGGNMLPLVRNESEMNIFSVPKTNLQIAPLICYESVFGQYATSYINEQANAFCLITNDDWWGNTPGHIQHFNYGRMRAIENRRFIARSANTGISCIINPYGEISSPILYYRDEGTVVGNITPINYITFYNKYKDYIYKIALIILGISLLYCTLYLIKQNKKSL